MIPLTLSGYAILSASVLVMLLAPRRWALVAMLVVTCYFAQAQGVLIGGFNFFSIRIIILAGLIRIFIRGEFRSLRSSPLDPLMVIWALWALTVSFFRVDPGATLTFNGGLVFNSLGTYCMLRVFCRNRSEVIFLCRVVAWLLVPIALEMIYEQLTESNLFSMLGDLPIVPEVREGRIRAQGPFSHSILAGTVGAVMMPMFLGLWKLHRFSAAAGTLAAVTIVITSASSGPKMSAIYGVLCLLLWRLRGSIRLLRWLAVGIYLMLTVVMASPPYYLMARLDLSGGSTGWYRARLIESSIEHLDEWWMVGTDFTRHWMQTGVGWSQNHVDLTNHYLWLGVQGGLPLLFLYVMLLLTGFTIVARSVRGLQITQPDNAFFCWALGASLFAHATTTISVSYYDQSFVFLYITLASIAGSSDSGMMGRVQGRAHSTHVGRMLVTLRTPPAIQMPIQDRRVRGDIQCHEVTSELKQ